MIIAMFAVMWFFIIRPAQKRQKNTAQMQNNLKRGDQIITVGGLHGKIVTSEDKVLLNLDGEYGGTIPATFKNL